MKLPTGWEKTEDTKYSVSYRRVREGRENINIRVYHTGTGKWKLLFLYGRDSLGEDVFDSKEKALESVMKIIYGKNKR